MLPIVFNTNEYRILSSFRPQSPISWCNTSHIFIVSILNSKSHIHYHSNNIECWLIKNSNCLTWQLHEMKWSWFQNPKTKNLYNQKSKSTKGLGKWPNYVVPHLFLADAEVGQLGEWKYTTTNKWLLPRQTTTHDALESGQASGLASATVTMHAFFIFI